MGVKKGSDTAVAKGGLKEMVARYEKKVIEDLMSHYGNDTKAKQKIAEKLNISPATLYRKIKELDFND